MTRPPCFDPRRSWRRVCAPTAPQPRGAATPPRPPAAAGRDTKHRGCRSRLALLPPEGKRCRRHSPKPSLGAREGPSFTAGSPGRTGSPWSHLYPQRREKGSVSSRKTTPRPTRWLRLVKGGLAHSGQPGLARGGWKKLSRRASGEALGCQGSGSPPLRAGSADPAGARGRALRRERAAGGVAQGRRLFVGFICRVFFFLRKKKKLPLPPQQPHAQAPP